MSFCPPPRAPSPQLAPNPLPSPPPGPRRISSRSRLHFPSNLHDPPIPPRLVGSPLLEKLALPDPMTLTPKIQKQLWFDGDEFGTRIGSHPQVPSPSSSASSPATPGTPRRTHRRTPSVVLVQRARSRSPPPPRLLSASVPPVPPIPSSAFDSPGAKRAVVRSPARPLIVIPDLESAALAAPPSDGGVVRRNSRRASRSYPTASSRRRSIVGCEAH